MMYAIGIALFALGLLPQLRQRVIARALVLRQGAV